MTRLLLAASTALALATGPAAAVTFNYTGAIVTWTVPQTGTYDIVAIGAQGGAGTMNDTFVGGLGALIGGSFELSSGTQLRIVVGGMGSSDAMGGGGGGASLVAMPLPPIIPSLPLPLVVAGGGGGIGGGGAGFGGGDPARQNGWDANVGPAGLSGSGMERQGGGTPLPTIGQGGPAAGSPGRGAGGAGYNAPGGSDMAGGFGSFVNSTGGNNWSQGWSGGASMCDSTATGGFGGGGGAAVCGTSAFMGLGPGAGGGGGGWSGGQGGWIGGGGGSYIQGALTTWSQAGAGTGNGLVTITLQGAPQEEEVTTPEPASAALSVLGLFALAALRRRR